MRAEKIMCILSLLIFFTGVCTVTEGKTREEIAEQYRWDFSDIYKNWHEWDASIREVSGLFERFLSLKGLIHDDPQKLIEALTLQEEIGKHAGMLFRYVSLQLDVDQRDQVCEAKYQEVRHLFAEYGSVSSWFAPELKSIPRETLAAWFKDYSELKVYGHYFDVLQHVESHILDEEKEELLSYFRPVGSMPSTLYTKLTVADRVSPKVTLSTGEMVTITDGTYSEFLMDPKLTQEDRRVIYEAYHREYKKNVQTFAALYQSVCQLDRAYAKARNYSSSIESELYGDKIPLSVYTNLTETVKKNTAPLQRYISLKKDIIMKKHRLDEYWAFDSRLPLLEENIKYPYDQVIKWVAESVKPLGESYSQTLNKAIESRWIDVFESEGKVGGAYNASVYGVHPYLLLNYNDTLDSVFTLTHEMGHMMHSLLSQKEQPYLYHRPVIFIAEVASTFHEWLMIEYMLKNSTDHNERIAVLRQAIGLISGTLYYQTFLADFEYQVHQMVEQGQPVTVDSLNSVYEKLDDSYYGHFSKEVEEFKSMFWAEVPHIFESPYYVYQYATCVVASAHIFDQVTRGPEKDREEALNRYKTLLQSGSNDYPMEILKKAGVDLTDPKTIDAVIQKLDSYVSQLEEELQSLP